MRHRVVATAAVLVIGAGLAPSRGATERSAPQTALADLEARSALAEDLFHRAIGVLRDSRAGVRRSEAPDAARPDRTAADVLIGPELSPLVTTLGSLESKRLSSHPLWARLLVRQLAAHGIGPGDHVTASLSGSFPGLNLALTAACRALGARLVAISSVTASTWGATEPGFTWPEMETRVVAAGVWPAVTVAVSVGGSRDNGADLSPEGLALARQIQAQAAAALGARRLETATLDEAIQARLEVYRQALGSEQPRVYVNVGGNHASLGGARAPLRHEEGWLTSLPEGAAASASVSHAYLAEDVPVLSLLNVRALARDWGLETGR
jgi:poly-gamma-glutamate system protein